MTSKLPPAVWREMTDVERTLAIAAAQIVFPYGAGQGKNLAAKLALVAKCDGLQITDRQADALRDIIQRYRRQLPPSIVALAAEVCA